LTADVEDSYEFVDADTLRYQNIVSSSSVETIRMKKGVKLVPNNNVVNPQAMYGDVDDISDDDDDDNEDDNDDGRISEEEESEESEESEKEEESQATYYADKSKSNANKMFKVEINVDDI